MSQLNQSKNHKHFRRRRRRTRIIPMDMMRFKSNFCHNFTLFLLPILSTIIITNTICEAQQIQQNYLLPGHNMENLHIPESQPVDSVIYQLKAIDRLNENRKFTYHMTGDHFRVDEQTGEVRLIKALDREVKSQLTVILSVFDISDTKSDLPVETKRRTIYVDDIDDSWPVFAARGSTVQTDQAVTFYQAEISEIAPIGSLVIGDIQVSDADEAANADLTFICRPERSTRGTCETFSLDFRRLSIGRYILSIRTKFPLDYERISSYRMVIVARGRRPSPLKGVPLETEAVVDIRLINIQDEEPIFVNAPYSLSMEEGSKNGTKLLNLFVQDGDSAPQRDLSVIVAPGMFSEFFQVSKDPDIANLWYLETKKVIDREDPQITRLGNIFNISLLAAELDDQGKPVASVPDLESALREQTFSRGSLRKENVTIVVLDVLDSRPTFIQSSSGKALTDNSLILNISESIETGTSIPNLDLAVFDMDQGINSKFNVRLEDSESGPSASAAFNLETDVVYGRSEIILNVINSSLLDYEDPALRVYKFSLIAAKNSNPSLAHIIEVQMNLMDSNDNSPVFDRTQYVLDVPEDAKPGFTLGIIEATDIDSGINGKLDYILRGPGASKFKLIESEGKIILNDCGLSSCLDYEIEQSYPLTYEARDGGNRVTNVSVIINVLDINDHAPKFSESTYRRELISDNLSSKQNYISPQLVVRARDEDGGPNGRDNVTYRIKSSNLTGLDVDPISGLVYLSQQIDLDALIANIEHQSGISRASMSRVMFEAEVEAEDSGEPPLVSSAKIHLTVRGNGDGAPRFKQDSYQAIVKENQPPNKSFFQVQAMDPDDKDSQLRYSLGNDINDFLQINSQTGEISFKESVSYEDFSGKTYNVTVYATDNSKPQPLKTSALLSVSVLDVNNKAPRFEQREYRTTLIEGKSKPGDIILEPVASDLDRGSQLNYSIIHDQIVMHDRNGLEFSIANLTNSSSNAYQNQLSKTDGLALANQLRNLIAINKRTGAIELRYEPDYSLAASISVPIRVVDMAASAEITPPPNESTQSDTVVCTFQLQAHIDRSPVFAPPWTIDRREYNITILEEQSIGTIVFSLLAKDPSTNQRIEMFEKVFESDPRNLFRVDQNGVVYVNGRIDYEELPAPKRLKLTVKAINLDDHFSFATINLQVLDINDNAPQFSSVSYSVQISESAQYPLDVLKVQAEDKDSSEFAQVYYSILSAYETQFFSIDPKRGQISLKKNAKLDRESEPSHSILVAASDCNETLSSNGPSSGCRKSSILVRVDLLDENDNDPTFTNVNKRGEFEAIISETVAVGTVITRAQAIDLDEGLNGQVNYEIASSPDELVSRLLSIDRDGYINVVDSFSGLGRITPYKIIVRASDNGKQSRQSYASLLLTVSDVVANDGVPKFTRPKADEIIQLSEATGPSTLVYQVQATDPDQESNGKLMYKFLNPSEVFDIDPFTGDIRTKARSNLLLDRELVPNYTLIVIAHDLGSPPKQSQQVLNIRLTDVNDNDPYFERTVDDEPLVLEINEEVPKDTLIGVIQAVDKDEGLNALIGYEIINGDQNLFRLDFDGLDNGNNPCRIFSNGRLDRETRESYTLVIKANSMNKIRGKPFGSSSNVHRSNIDPLGGRNPFNQYNASDLSKIKLVIKLQDINDNRPTFSEQNAKSIVDSTAQPYGQVMVFQAKDADASSSEIQYSLLDVIFHKDPKFQIESGRSSTVGSFTDKPVSMKHVFDIDPRTGVLRNSASLRGYVDGHFEVYVKADSGSFSTRDDSDHGKCAKTSESEVKSNNTSNKLYGELENCSVAVAKGVVLITQQRETFRFLFNATKLKDRLNDFNYKLGEALGNLVYTIGYPQPDSSDPFRKPKSLAQSAIAIDSKVKSDKLLLNIFNTDFLERDDGSLDFSTLTSCSQLVKFDEQSRNPQASNSDPQYSISGHSSQIPTQVINFDQVLGLIKALNQSQSQLAPNLFNEYGVMGIERCLPSDRTQVKLTLFERISLYMAIFIAVAGSLLAMIVSQMRRSYEKNLKILQRSKYQFMSHGAPLQARMAPHHLSLTSLQAAQGFITHPGYMPHHLTPSDYDGVPMNTWQL